MLFHYDSERALEWITWNLAGFNLAICTSANQNSYRNDGVKLEKLDLKSPSTKSS